MAHAHNLETKGRRIKNDHLSQDRLSFHVDTYHHVVIIHEFRTVCQKQRGHRIRSAHLAKVHHRCHTHNWVPSSLYQTQKRQQRTNRNTKELPNGIRRSSNGKVNERCGPVLPSDSLVPDRSDHKQLH